MQLPPPPWQGWAGLAAKLRSLLQRWALPRSPAWEGKGWSQGPVPCRVCAGARQEGVAALWVPGVPSLGSALCPRDLGVLRVPGTGGGRNLPSPHMRGLDRSGCLRFLVLQPPGLLGKWESSSSPSL